MLKVSNTSNHNDKDTRDDIWQRLSNLPHPAWLKGELIANRLSITDPVITPTSKVCVLDLDIPLSDGSLLTSPSNEHWHQLALEYTYFIRERGIAEITTAITHVQTVRRLLVLLQWLRQQGLMRLSAMTSDHAEQFAKVITFGAGHALSIADRLSNYFASTPSSDLPTRRDKLYAARITLDIEAICRTLHIDFHSLSADLRASYLLAVKAKDIGYVRPNQEALLKRYHSLPPPNRIGNENLRRYLLLFQNLYRLRTDIHSDQLAFFPALSLPPIARKSKKKDARTENIPPRLAMSLLDRSIRWVLNYGPEILDLLDVLEGEYEHLSTKAHNQDFIATPHMRRMLANCTQLHIQLAKQIIAVRPENTFALARHLDFDLFHFHDFLRKKNNAYNEHPRLLSFVKVSTNQDNDYFDNVREIVLQILRRNRKLNSELPRSVTSLAKLIGSDTRTILKFLKDNNVAPSEMLIRLRDYLRATGWTILPSSIEFSEIKRSSNTWRLDAGIERQLKDFLTKYEAKTAGPGEPWPIDWNFAATSRTEGISLFDALTVHIPMACLVVNATFSARRKTSLTSLEAGCFVTDDIGFGYLHAFIEKTDRAKTFLPCPEIVGKSVNLLERWSASARSLSGSPRLYQQKLPWSSVRIPGRINRDLNKFASAVGVDLQSFRLKTRQFRRFFAMTYIWRYKLGDFEALSYFLRHKTIGSTYAYVTEAVGGDVMLEVQSELTRHMYLRVISGTDTCTGPLARRIKRYGEKLLGHIRSTLQIVSAQELNDSLISQIDTLVADSGRLLLPNPWGFCGCGNRPRDVAKAACAQLKQGHGIPEKRPDLSRISLCARCPHLLTDGDFEQYWREKERQLANSTNDANLPEDLRKLAANELKQISRFIRLNFPGV